ncbi:MAG: phage capsid protein [Caulobacter sp.]
MVDLPGHYRVQFASTVSLLLQQRGSKLRPHVMTSPMKGKAASPVDQYGVSEATERFARNEPKTAANTPTDRRWAYPRFFDWSEVVDDLDTLQSISDPQNPLVQSCNNALGRRIDDEILRAFFADAKTGEQGGTTVSFPAGQQVGVNVGGAGTPLNVMKLRASKKILMANEVDLEADPIICVVNAVQHDALFNEVQITSADFNGGDKPVMKDGKIMRFLGIEFVHCERVNGLRSGGNDLIPVYAKSGLALGVWGDIATDIGPRRDLKGNPTEISGSLTVGATRTEEKKVVQIACDDTI